MSLTNASAMGNNSFSKILARFIVKFLLKIFYRVEVCGAENFKQLGGGKAVLICNHQSFLDAPVLALFLPQSPTFAINKFVAQKKLFKPFLSFCKTFEVDTSSPLSIKDIVEHVNKGDRVLIFPEGRITVTGSLMKFYNGPAMVADRTGALVLPIVLENLEFTYFSRMAGKLPLKLFKKVRIHILPPFKPELKDNVPAKERKILLANQLYDRMCEAVFEVKRPAPLFKEFLNAADIYGNKRHILQDVSRTRLTYKQLLIKSLAVGGVIAKHAKPGEYVGLMLPNGNAAVVSFLGMQAYGLVPAMLNFGAGEAALLSACDTAGLKTVITSRAFIEAAGLQDSAAALSTRVNLLYLENLAQGITPAAKLAALVKAKSGCGWIIGRRAERDVNRPAVIMFTSGSEGAPKGVALSHANISYNRYQIMSRVDFGCYDTMFNALPMFHSFGLMVGTLLPLLSGIPSFLYPSPLHSRIIPEVIYDCCATIIFGTDTFLSRYAKYAHPYDFHSLRYIFAGAEKLRDETRRMYAEKFGVRILEGYGVTETSPVLSVNTAIENRIGSVGKLMPGLEYKLIPVEGITEGGRLYIKGANVMLGYLLPQNPGKIEPLVTEAGEGWHDTGDIVTLDTEGYLYIKGRAKRFAKIGGEMVSLTFVENYVNRLWPEAVSAVVTRPDAKKGEQLILITSRADASPGEVLKFAQSQGVPEIYIPRKIIYMKEIPILATGKVNYPALNKLDIADTVNTDEEAYSAAGDE